jgi:hypothetical protein
MNRAKYDPDPIAAAEVGAAVERDVCCESLSRQSGRATAEQGAVARSFGRIHPYFIPTTRRNRVDTGPLESE